MGGHEDGELSFGDSDAIEAISCHIERHVGPIQQVWHEIISPDIHVDVHQVAPTAECPYHILITSGMSEKPMNVPEEMEGFRYAEVFLALPERWPLSQEAFRDENNYWPVRLVKQLARFPHHFNTWLGHGHTVANGEPAEPYAPGVGFTGAILLAPMSVATDFESLSLPDGRTVHFWEVMPLYPEELSHKLNRGLESLLSKLEAAGVEPAVNPKRKNACRSSWKWPWS